MDLLLILLVATAAIIVGVWFFAWTFAITLFVLMLVISPVMYFWVRRGSRISRNTRTEALRIFLSR